MTASNVQYLKDFHDKTKAAGAKAISSDFAFEIEGQEASWLLTKQCPWPTLSTAGEIEVAGPMGSAGWELQQTKVNQQGPISFFETVAGSINTMLFNINAQGGRFNAKIYEGTPDRFLRAKRIRNCFMMLDNPDRDWENRSQVLIFSGTLFFHYFGEELPGNVSSL